MVGKLFKRGVMKWTKQENRFIYSNDVPNHRLQRAPDEGKTRLLDNFKVNFIIYYKYIY